MTAKGDEQWMFFTIENDGVADSSKSVRGRALEVGAAVVSPPRHEAAHAQ
jgi:hypothetical protein